MTAKDTFSFIPHDLQSIPWIQNLVTMLQEQSRVIQEQAEEIAALKKTVQEQKDEINRLKKMPTRPILRPKKGNSKERSGKPDSNKNKDGSDFGNDISPKKIREEKHGEKRLIVCVICTLKNIQKLKMK